MDPNPKSVPQPAAPATPFVLDPLLVERIWGTQDLAPWSEKSSEGKVIGEIWLTAESCKVQGGSAAGATLAEVTERSPAALGDPRGQGFPLLIKFLFPHEKLSVQVHPNDLEAQALGMPRGKTECWYVVSAEPGAQLALGFREPLSKSEVKRAIEDGSIENKLRLLPVKAGDLVFVDAGTVHAIGPGMVVLETQQYSDTTYRLWDYGRPRELHVDAGAAVTRTTTRAGLIAPEAMDGWTRLVSSEYFVVDRFDVSAGHTSALGEASKLQILIALSGDATLEGGPEAMPLPKAHAVVLPVSGTSYGLRTASETAQVIRIVQP